MAKKIAWTDQAKADLRAIDRPTALRILHGLARFLATEEGDIKRLQDIEPPQTSPTHRRLPRPLPRPRRQHRDPHRQAPLRSLPLKSSRSRAYSVTLANQKSK